MGLATCFKSQKSVVPVHLDVNPDTPEKMIEWAKAPSNDHRSKPTFCDPVTYHYMPAQRQSSVEFRPGRRFPKRLHQFWLGSSKPPPYDLINTCRSLHPDWNIMLWTEDNLKTIKHDSKYPYNAIEFVLKNSNLKLSEIDHIVFFEKPFLKFERLLETYLAFAPKGFASFSMAMPIWLREKLFQKKFLF